MSNHSLFEQEIYLTNKRYRQGISKEEALSLIDPNIPIGLRKVIVTKIYSKPIINKNRYTIPI